VKPGRRPLALLLCLAALGLALGWPTQALVLRLPRQDGRLVEAVRVTTGEMVRLTYRHSVEGTLVQGRFRVGPGPSLLLEETRLDSIGTGLPLAGRSRREEGQRVVDEGGRPLAGLRFFYSPVNQTRLEAAGRPVSLEGLEAGSLLFIGLEPVRLWRWLAWRLAGLAWSGQGEGE